MDFCHLKHSELAELLRKYKGSVVLRGDGVKDDTGGFAVFTEQGPPASHMTAANVLDTTSRLPGLSGEVNDAVSAYTQVKMSDASRSHKRQETECPTVWMRLLRNRRPKHWDNIDDPLVHYWVFLNQLL